MASHKNTDQTVRMATTEQLTQIWALVLQALPKRLTWAQAQHWIGHGRELAGKIRTIFAVADPYCELLAAWEKFYRDEFGMTTVDLSGLRVPDEKPGFSWLIVVVPGVTIEMVLAACKKYFPVGRWTDDSLDGIVESVRSAVNGSYAIWVRPGSEADAEHANKSYNDIKAAGIKGVTLLEYVLQYLKHYVQTKNQLDIQGWTLCSGSVCRGGRAVYAYGGCDKLLVSWCHRGYASPDLRSREAVVAP